MSSGPGYNAAPDGRLPTRPSPWPCAVCGQYALEPVAAASDRLVCAVCGAHRLGACKPGQDLSSTDDENT